VCLRFGNCNNGAHDGVRARNWNNDAANANWNIGFALILLLRNNDAKKAFHVHL
jgi:hypothetical protein